MSPSKKYFCTLKLAEKRPMKGGQIGERHQKSLKNFRISPKYFPQGTVTSNNSGLNVAEQRGRPMTPVARCHTP